MAQAYLVKGGMVCTQKSSGTTPSISVLDCYYGDEAKKIFYLYTFYVYSAGNDKILFPMTLLIIAYREYGIVVVSQSLTIPRTRVADQILANSCRSTIFFFYNAFKTACVTYKTHISTRCRNLM